MESNKQIKVVSSNTSKPDGQIKVVDNNKKPQYIKVTNK
jgi:hypothetical protein